MQNVGQHIRQNKEIIFNFELKSNCQYYLGDRVRRGRDRMVVGFSTTCAISAYHH